MDEFGLTIKQRLFVDEYIVCGIGYEAAKRAGYKGNYSTLATVATQNMQNPKICAYYEHRLQEKTLTANEVLQEIAAIARGLPGDCWTEEGEIDMQKVKEHGLTNLIQSVSTHKYGKRISAYSRLQALETLAKHYQLLSDKQVTEHTGEITVTFKRADNDQPSPAPAITTNTQPPSLPAPTQPTDDNEHG